MEPIWSSLASYSIGKMNIGRLNGDKFKDIRKSLQVRYYPTFLLFVLFNNIGLLKAIRRHIMEVENLQSCNYLLINFTKSFPSLTT